MSYQFGSFPAASTGLTTSIPSFGTTYGGFSGLTSAASPFTTSGFGTAAPVAYSPGFATTGFGAQPAFSGSTFGATTAGFSGLGGLYSGVGAAPTSFNPSFNAIPSGFAQATPAVFGGFSAQQLAQYPGFSAPGSLAYPGFSTPASLAQNAFIAQAQQQGDAQARGRQVSKIEYGLGVPTMIPKDGNEEKLERTPSGNLPRREASRGELSLRTRSFSTPQSPQNAPNAMAAYLSQNTALAPGMAQALAASTMSPRNPAAPTGHRGSNPREQVPW